MSFSKFSLRIIDQNWLIPFLEKRYTATSECCCWRTFFVNLSWVFRASFFSFHILTSTAVVQRHLWFAISLHVWAQFLRLAFLSLVAPSVPSSWCSAALSEAFLCAVAQSLLATLWTGLNVQVLTSELRSGVILVCVQFVVQATWRSCLLKTVYEPLRLAEMHVVSPWVVGQAWQNHAHWLCLFLWPIWFDFWQIHLYLPIFHQGDDLQASFGQAALVTWGVPEGFAGLVGLKRMELLVMPTHHLCWWQCLERHLLSCQELRCIFPTLR